MHCAPVTSPRCSIIRVLYMSDSISATENHTPIARRSFSPKGALAIRRFAIVMLRALDDHADWDAVACGCGTAAPAEMPCAMGPSRAGQG
jgi:hypothetical protein